MNRILPCAAAFLTLTWSSLALAAPVKIDRSSKALEFTYEWPAEAARIPALDKRFRADLAKALREARSNAAEDQALAKQQERDFNPHFYSVQWVTAGQTPQLLSLASQSGSFEGGAHPNTNYGALLWDRRSNREIALGSLFIRPGAFEAAMRAPYCAALDRQRARKREGEPGGLPEFNACPKFSELAISPVDKNHDGRFDKIEFVAAPYTAGPYVEGEYEVILPVTRKLVAGIKPLFRPSFAAQPQ